VCNYTLVDVLFNAFILMLGSSVDEIEILPSIILFIISKYSMIIISISILLIRLGNTNIKEGKKIFTKVL
jgi:hypothetical protein